MDASTAAPAATLCPLCGHPNQCAMELARATGQEQSPCWCAAVDFSRELLAQVPADALGRACICSTCAAREVV